MTNIRRYPNHGAPVFVTAVCRERTPFLKSPSSKELLLAVMREVKSETEFTMMAYVVLDDHFHWLIKPKLKDISGVMQSVKLRFSRRFRTSHAESPIASCWQPRFWDHVVRDQKDLNRHLDYIHYSPVKHGYVRQASDFRFSSFATHVKRGGYDANWGNGIEPNALENMEFE